MRTSRSISICRGMRICHGMKTYRSMRSVNACFDNTDRVGLPWKRSGRGSEAAVEAKRLLALLLEVIRFCDPYRYFDHYYYLPHLISFGMIAPQKNSIIP